MRSNQRGVGLTIILVAFTFFELIMIGIYNYTNLSQLSKSSALLSKDQLAINLAHTNCKSSSDQFVEWANTPGKQEFDAVRNPEIKSLSQSVDIEHDSVGTTGIVLSESAVSTISHNLFGEDERESYGIMEFKSRAEFSRRGFRLIDKKVSVYREYRNVFTGFPRPFNQMLFFLKDPSKLLDGKEFNHYIKQSFSNVKTINYRLENLIEYTQETVADVRKTYDFDYLDNIVNLIEQLSIDFEAPELSFYPDQFSLASRSINSKLDLLILRDPQEIKRISARIEQKDRDAWIVFDELKSIIEQLVFHTEEFEVKATHDELEKHLFNRFQTVEEFANLQQQRLDKISDFQNSIIAVANTTFDAEKASDKFSLDVHRQKAFFVLKGNDIQSQWDQFVNSLPVINGTIFIDNVTTKVKLSGALKGKSTLVCSGDVDISDLKSEREGRDHINVIAHKNVTISGSNRVNLHVGSKLKMQPGSSVEGAVYLNEYNTDSNMNAVITTNQDNEIEDPSKLYYFALGPRTISTIVGGE